MQIEQIAWRGWQCLRLRAGGCELRLPTEIGPRVLYAGFADGPNLLGLIEEDIGRRGGADFRLYGGHRLWLAPEHQQRTYTPDNQPPQIRQGGAELILEQAPDEHTGIQKTLRILPGAANEQGAAFRLVHELRNTSERPLTGAAWALTVMATGGVGILPLPERGAHPRDLLPNTRLVFWPYCDLGDARWGWGRRHLRLRQDPAQSSAQKVGAPLPAGWLGYAVRDCLFVKTFPFEEGARYPDDGCNGEIFVNDRMLELESLSPLSEIEPGATIRHEERWHFYRDLPAPESDAQIVERLLPRMAGILNAINQKAATGNENE